MKSGQINRSSPLVDAVEILTGTWNEYDADGFHIVVTPFFTVLSAVLDAGSAALPFRVTTPVAGTLFHDGGGIEAVIIRPGQTAIHTSEAGILQISLFGDQAKIVRLLS